ncbi:hypothetical protein EV177_010233, partial [Coemansia sp. RSA 1804]
ARFIPGPPPNRRDKQMPQFGVHHFHGAVMYSVDGFSARNADLEASADFYSLFKDHSRSALVRRMFGATQIALDYHPEDDSAIVGTFLSTRPATRATIRRARTHKGGAGAEEDEEEGDFVAAHEVAALDDDDPANTYVGEVCAALEDVLAAADQCKLWHVVHIKAGTGAAIQHQVRGLGLVEMTQRRAPIEFTVGMRFDDFIARYTPVAH